MIWVCCVLWNEELPAASYHSGHAPMFKRDCWSYITWAAGMYFTLSIVSGDPQGSLSLSFVYISVLICCCWNWKKAKLGLFSRMELLLVDQSLNPEPIFSVCVIISFSFLIGKMEIIIKSLNYYEDELALWTPRI